MLKTFNWGRGTGKTYEVIKRMEEDQDLFLLVPTSFMKRPYPEYLHSRIDTARNLLDGKLAGRKLKKVILDEGFLYRGDEIAKIYYYLGEHNIPTDAYGTA